MLPFLPCKRCIFFRQNIDISVVFPSCYSVSESEQPTPRLTIEQYKDKYGAFQYTRAPFIPSDTPETTSAGDPPVFTAPAPPQEPESQESQEELAQTLEEQQAQISNLLDSSGESSPIEITTERSIHAPPLPSSSTSFQFGNPPPKSARPKATNSRISTNSKLYLP